MGVFFVKSVVVFFLGGGGLQFHGSNVMRRCPGVNVVGRKIMWRKIMWRFIIGRCPMLRYAALSGLYLVCSPEGAKYNRIGQRPIVKRKQRPISYQNEIFQKKPNSPDSASSPNSLPFPVVFPLGFSLQEPPSSCR